MSRGRCLPILLASLVVCLATGSAYAQVTTATIFGVVEDQSQGVLPGATVIVRNVETGVARTVATDAEGRYRVPNLAVGSYAVEAELSGFQSVVRSGIVLTVGREAEVNFTLSIGELSDKVEVTGEAPLVETSRGQLADLVDQRQIAELPLNNRSFTELALLQPGVMTRGGSGFSGTSGGGVALAISGARPTNTAFFVDGMDVKDAFGRTPGSAAGTNLGVDTIREFQVLVNNFSAQFGGSGGVVNAITKSGTNTLHGTGFYQLRHDKLDSADYFQEQRGEDRPPFNRHQAGFSVGGPIVTDRMFYFGTYEMLRERNTLSETINVPGASLRAGVTPAGTVTVHPLSKKFLDAMPLPNGELFSDGTGEYIFDRIDPIDQHYAMAKVDYQMSEKDSLFFRFTRDVAENKSGLAFPEFFVSAETRVHHYIVEHNRIVSPTLLNTARFALNRSEVTMANGADGIDESFNLIPLPGRVPAQMQVPSIDSWGNRGFDDRYWNLSSFQFAEKITWTTGRHSLVGGMDVTRIHLDGYSASRLHGRVRFNSMNDFLRGVPLAWEFLVPGTGSDPAPGEDPRSFRQHQVAFFVQDDFRVKSNLTVNLGLRWEFVDSPTEVNGLISNLRNFMDPVETIGDPFFETKKSNVGPRLGVAWDPTGSGKTSIRGGFGMFYQPLNYATWQIAAVQNAPYFIRATIDRPTWPPPIGFDLSNLPPGNPTPMEFEPETPYYMHYNATWQRQLLSDAVVSVSYAGSRGRNLASTLNYNVREFQVLDDGSKFFPATGSRFNPNFAAIETRAFNLRSDYNSVQLRGSKRFGAGLQLQSSYTYSKNMDNGSETQGTALMDPYDPLLDYGLSDWHVAHSWSFNYIYQLPFFQNRGGALEAALGGWQMSGILSVRSGLPSRILIGFNRSRDLNVLSASGNNDRPNLKAGADPNPVTGDIGRWADPSAFELPPAGTHGNLGRNTLLGPNQTTFDLSLVKSFPFSADGRIELRFAFFNLFNRANFSQPNTTIFTNASGNPSPNFGRITSVATTPRQGQFVVKVLF
jgi:hypothetical protein